jgi:DNA-binding NarL/FixJ family response regulator
MIRILLVDDHPVLRAGLTAILRTEPGLIPVDGVGSAEEAWPALRRTRPDVVIVDYHLPDEDGLVLCRRIKRQPRPPAVLVYSAQDSLVLPATLAGADGLIEKGAPAGQLYDAVRTVARGARVMPPRDRAQLSEAHARLAADDLPILGMALDHTPPTEIATVLGVAPADVHARIDTMLGQLRHEVVAQER